MIIRKMTIDDYDKVYHQRFAYSFLQIPFHDGRPCCSAMYFVVACVHAQLSPVKTCPCQTKKDPGSLQLQNLRSSSYYCFCSLNIMNALITMIPMEIMNTLPHIASILLSCVTGITTFCTILSTTFFGGLGVGGGGGDGLL